MYTVSISTWKLLVVVTVKKVYKIWKENKVVALRVRLIPQYMLNEFIYIMCLLLLQIEGYIGSGLICGPTQEC